MSCSSVSQVHLFLRNRPPRFFSHQQTQTRRATTSSKERPNSLQCVFKQASTGEVLPFAERGQRNSQRETYTMAILKNTVRQTKPVIKLVLRMGPPSSVATTKGSCSTRASTRSPSAPKPSCPLQKAGPLRISRSASTRKAKPVPIARPNHMIRATSPRRIMLRMKRRHIPDAILVEKDAQGKQVGPRIRLTFKSTRDAPFIFVPPKPPGAQKM